MTSDPMSPHATLSQSAEEASSSGLSSTAVQDGSTAPTNNNASPHAETSTTAEGVIDIALFAQVQLRVGEIVAAEALPKSKKLLKLKVDLGALGQRQILAGIALFYSPDTLVGRRVVVVANLKPATLMGHTSEGMLLAASAADNSTLSLIDPGDKVPLGAEVR